MKNDISMVVVRRLPKYHRFLTELEKKGVQKICSTSLAELMVSSASQVRQDFSCFGGFGHQGYGYNVSQLKREIEAVLGLNKIVHYNAIIVGAGNLGRAVASHMDFDAFGITPVAVFDNNPELFGTMFSYYKIQPIKDVVSYSNSIKINLAILCLPAEFAESVVDTLYNECNIRNYWNFTNYNINNKYDDAFVENVNLSDSLMTLCYRIRQSNEKNKT